MAHQHNWAIQCHSRWFTLENTGQKRWQIKNTNTYRNWIQPRKSKQCKIQQNRTTPV